MTDKPEVIEDFDLGRLTPLVTSCQDYLDQVENDEVDDDQLQYIFEAAMEFVFGKDVWVYINEKRQNE